jgi:hypothetical protein
MGPGEHGVRQCEIRVELQRLPVEIACLAVVLLAGVLKKAIAGRKKS